MKRKIISIDEALCNGCELCVKACHEGAIEMIDGKARLVADEYCDGLGDCLPECPTGAITIIERESRAYDEELVKQKIEAGKKSHKKEACVCPGIAARGKSKGSGESVLANWPVQLSLVGTNAPYFNNADILIAADCTAFASGSFHADHMAGKVVMIGCPKLDDTAFYRDKLTEIFEENEIKSVTVARMSVPCCGGLVYAVRNALEDSGRSIPYSEVIIDTSGEVISM